MKHALTLLPVLIALALPPASVTAAGAVEMTPELAKKNLAKIPPTDPPAVNPPKLLSSMIGRHPRVLFTDKEIDGLKKLIASDPILQKTAEGVLARGKSFKLRPDLGELLTSGDTPALATGNGDIAQLAYAYALNHDPATKQAIIDVLKAMLKTPYWSYSHELDASMGAACNMMMVAVLYDAVYNDLPPDLRAQVAQKILTQARRLYYLGFKQLAVPFPGIGYWQSDPQPNHRWYRLRGMVSSLLAIADEKGLETGFLLEAMKQEMDFLMKWYPVDGDCHEGAGYQVFGFRSLVETAMMMDRVLGTDYLRQPGFKNAWKQHLYYWVPAQNSDISFGDDQNAPGVYQYDCPPFLIGPHLTRDKNAQAALLRQYRLGAKGKDGNPTYPWTLLEFYDPTVGEGDYQAVPKSYLFDDLGAASMRDSWADDAVILTFKCGPYGGYKLNEYRQAVPDAKGDLHYINVAHDDPDANSIAMSIGGDFIFHPGLYSTKKMTDTSSSITVDGKGQIMEGDSYTQPVPKFDMRKLAYLTGWKAADKGRIIIEGEAGNAYRVPAATDETKPAAGADAAATAPPKEQAIPNPVLKKFRRSTIWMPGEYILVLDDIVSDGPRLIMWRGSVEKAQFLNPEEGRCQILTKTGKQVDLQILGNKPFQGAIEHLFLAGRWGNELIQQLQFSIKSDAIKFACLLDPWNKKPAMTLTENGDTVTLKIHSATFDDTWTWQSAKDSTKPSAVTGTRGAVPLISLSENDQAPRGDSASRE